MPSTPTRVNRRYKTQLRDFLSTCRTKRKLSHGSNSGQMTPTTNATVSAPVMNPMPTVDYITTDGCTAAAAYNMYTTPYAPTAATDHGLSSYMSHSANFQHSLYSTPTALDNRYLTTTENLFHQYRPLGSYYPEYHHTAPTTPYVGNGFLDMPSRATSCTMPTYDPSATTAGAYQLSGRTAVMPVDDKLYSCQQVVDTTATTKYPTYVDSSRGYVVANTGKCLDVSWPYSVSPSSGIIQPVQVMSTQLDMAHKPCGKLPKHPSSIDGMSSTHSEVPSPVNNGILTPKMEEMKADVAMMQSGSPGGSHHLAMAQQQQNSIPPPHHFSPVTATSVAQEVTRQTVLMWGSGGANHLQQQQHTPASSSNNSRSPPSNPGTPTVSGHYTTVTGACDPLKSLAEMNSIGVSTGTEMCKWNGSVVDTVKSEAVVTTVAASQPGSPALGQQQPTHPHPHSHQSSRVVMVL